MTSFVHLPLLQQLLVIAEDGNIQRVICSNSSSLEGLLVAPPEVNLTAAHQVLCSLNETAVAVELTREVAKIREKVPTATSKPGTRMSVLTPANLPFFLCLML